MLVFAGSSQALAMSFDGNGHDYMAAPTVPEATTSSTTSDPAPRRTRDADTDSAPPTRTGSTPGTLNTVRARHAPAHDGDDEHAEQRLQRWQSRVPGALK